MTRPRREHFLVVGAGAAGLMAACELARAGKRVIILEARQRCGGRIWALPAEEFGYKAEGGAEFVHGAAPVTRGLLREAGLAIAPRRGGTRWRAGRGALAPDEASTPDAGRFYRALMDLPADLPIAEFLERHFAGPRYEALRRAITRRVEGYDAADPYRASSFALREEWLAEEGPEEGGRIAGGYGALVDHLAAECRRYGAVLRLGAPVAAIEARRGGLAAICRDGTLSEADAAVLAVSPPLLAEMALPAAARERAAAAAAIGFGNVVKLLLRFATRWWIDHGGRDLANLSFVLSDAAVPTWWTQHPAQHPVLTGWYAGPKAELVADLGETDLVAMGLAALGEIFDRSVDRLRHDLVAARAINWGTDPFARGAYSYATLETRHAQEVLCRVDGDQVYFSGEALYAGPDMGTVEAALAIGQETAQAILTAAGS